MGTDIHIRIEKRVDDQWVDVPWTSGDRRRYYPKHNPVDKVEMPNCIDWRNYRLFSVLANVRNGGGITPITEPRDIPADSPDRAVTYSVRQFATYGAYEDPI